MDSKKNKVKERRQMIISGSLYAQKWLREKDRLLSYS